MGSLSYMGLNVILQHIVAKIARYILCFMLPFVTMIGHFVPKGWPQFTVLIQVHGVWHAKRHLLLAGA